MNRIKTRDILAVTAVCAIATTTFAQFRATQTEATTARFDAQHTGWTPVDRYIAPDKMSGFSLQWKTKVDNTARNGAALSSGIVASGGLGIMLAHLGASDNRTIAIDMDNGHVFFDRAYAASSSTNASRCLSASVATPTHATPLTPVIPAPPRPDGQSINGPNTQLPYGSVIGEPGEGIPPVKPGAMFAAPGSFSALPGAKAYDGTPASAAAGSSYVTNATPAGRGAAGERGPVNADGGGAPGVPRRPGGAGARRTGAPVNFGGRNGGPTYALSNDGVLHALTSNGGFDGQQPMPFLPAGAQATDLVMIDGVVYVATVNGCGGAPNGVWAIKPAATPAGGVFPKVSSWNTGGTASPSAPSFDAEGTMFVAVGSGTGQVSDAVVSLDPATLTVKSSFTMAGANFINAPVIFRMDAHDIIAAQAADGRIFLLDAANLSAPLSVLPAAKSSGGYRPAALATWEDSTSQRWLLSTTPTSVIAYKVTGNGNATSLSPGWTLSGLKTPLAPLIVNGVVFALSSGDAAVAAKGSAQLFAVDGITGRALWNSGKAITGYVPRSSALWNSMGQILFGTENSTIYAFGVNLERHL